jgi:hypothetical protein
LKAEYGEFEAGEDMDELLEQAIDEYGAVIEGNDTPDELFRSVFWGFMGIKSSAESTI